MSETENVAPEISSQESKTSSQGDKLQDPMKNLELESPKKKGGRKRNRVTSDSKDSAKPPAKSGPTSNPATPLRKRGRPKKSEGVVSEPVVKEPVTDAYKLEDYPTGGVLMAFGMGDAGQLGLGEDIMERKKPQPVKDIDEDIVCMAAGGMHNVFVNIKGQVFTFGCNDEGALGRTIQEEEESFTPGQVEGFGKAVYCCAGDSHSAIINEDGEVWVWGTFRDANGRLGMGTGTENNSEVEKAVLKEPAKLKIPQKILRMASGADHLIMLDLLGGLWSLGCAESGQLGRVSSHFCAKGGRRGAGKVLNPEQIHLNRRLMKDNSVIDVACGQFSSFLITNSGKVFGFGLNNCYQLGPFEDREIRYKPEIVPFKFDGEDVKVKQISSGMHHTILLSTEGDVYTIGCGDYGRLGVGQKDSLRESEVLCKVKLDGKITRVSSGSCTSYAIDSDGKCYAWGMGSNLQLTNGSEDDEWEPIQLKGKNVDGKKIERIDGGGQHVVVLVNSTVA